MPQLSVAPSRLLSRTRLAFLAAVQNRAARSVLSPVARKLTVDHQKLQGHPNQNLIYLFLFRKLFKFPVKIVVRYCYLQKAGFSCSEIPEDGLFSSGMKGQTTLGPNPFFPLEILKQKNLIFFHFTPNIYEIFSYSLLGNKHFMTLRGWSPVLKELRFFIIYSL